MRGHGGAVVIVASISGWKPAPNAQYGAAKAAEIALAAELARELAPEGIRVNAVSPGSVLVPDGGWDRYRAQKPARFAELKQRNLPTKQLSTRARTLDQRANICIDGAQGRPSAAGW